MAVINYLEEDDATIAEIAERYEYTDSLLSRWVDRLDGSLISRLSKLSTTIRVKADQVSSLTKNTISSLKYFTSHHKQSAMTRPRGLFCRRVTISPKNSTLSTVNATFDD